MCALTLLSPARDLVLVRAWFFLLEVRVCCVWSTPPALLLADGAVLHLQHQVPQLFLPRAHEGREERGGRKRKRKEEERREKELACFGDCHSRSCSDFHTQAHLWPKMESVYLPCWRSKCLVGYFERLGWLVHANVTKPRAAALSGCC